MRVFFLASGILEDGSVAFFHMNLCVFLKQNCFFNESVCFFGFRHFGKPVLLFFFPYECIIFLEQNWFFDEMFVFLASGILEDGSVAFFSYEFISFF